MMTTTTIPIKESKSNSKPDPRSKSFIRFPRRNLDGILVLDKPTGITSNAALQIVKRLFRANKAGHTGSLDPLASGLLPICFGEATKFSQFLLDSDKHYRFVAKLGIRTDSGDSEGRIIDEKPVPSTLTLTDIETVLEKFRGNIQQIPSMYSALKHQGQPLYKLAREGITVERAARPVTIYNLSLLSYDPDTQHLTLEVKASKGTYVRTLVDDLGEILGCGAHVIELRRLGAGPFVESQMIRLPMIEALVTQNVLEPQNDINTSIDNLLLPLESSVSSFQILKLSEATAFYMRQGQPVIVPYAPTSGWVRLYINQPQLGKDRFIGVGEVLEDGKVAPRRLLSARSPNT